MGKFFIRLSILFLVILVSLLIYLSYFGINTSKFNSLIKNEANKVNQYVKLEFKNTKIYLNPKEFNITLKLQDPKILIKNNEVVLYKINLFLPLKSFITSDFILKRAEVAFVKNDIKDLIKISNIFLPKIITKRFNKVFVKGKLYGEFIIPFDTDGKIGKNYSFSGKISDSLINITKELSIKNLTTQIKHIKHYQSDQFKVIIEKGSVYELDLSESIININRNENETQIKSSLITNGDLNYSQINKIFSLLSVSAPFIKSVEGNIDLKTNINFNLNKSFKISNLTYSLKGKINNLEIDTLENKIIKQYLPTYDPKIFIKDTKIKFNKKKK